MSHTDATATPRGSARQFITDGESEYGEADRRIGMEDSIGVDVAEQDGDEGDYGDDGDDGNDADHSNGGGDNGQDDGDGDNGAEEDDAAVTKAWKIGLLQEAEEELVFQDALGPLPTMLDPPIRMPIVRLSRVSPDSH
ncbi:hypothetical protein E4U14_001141, partial [Claviceps sp. LM454 group G7]